ncbi:MAG TPA: DNRLRE domain-containing protein [Vicinamibacterales bacterium]|nr:DNRLRE domain-containing protein [Vicinamibacterales bacterium]
MKTLVAVATLLLSTVAFAQTPSVTRRRAVRPETPLTVAHRTVTIAASKDNTLYQTADGSASNGAGPHLFAGATGNGELRRALIAFNVTSQIPPGSQVTRVVLTLHVSASISGAQPMALHRVTADWGEGASVAQPSPYVGGGDGRGTASKAGDATWIHAIYPDKRWTNAGGDFDATADATVTTGSSDYRWESAAMIPRVQQWLDEPRTNFGWIVIGNESTGTTTKKFDSRHVLLPTVPALTVEFDVTTPPAD